LACRSCSLRSFNLLIFFECSVSNPPTGRFVPYLAASHTVRGSPAFLSLLRWRAGTLSSVFAKPAFVPDNVWSALPSETWFLRSILSSFFSLRLYFLTLSLFPTPFRIEVVRQSHHAFFFRFLLKPPKLTPTLTDSCAPQFQRVSSRRPRGLFLPPPPPPEVFRRLKPDVSDRLSWLSNPLQPF